MKGEISRAKIEITGRMTPRGADRVAAIYAASFLVIAIGIATYLLIRATSA